MTIDKFRTSFVGFWPIALGQIMAWAKEQEGKSQQGYFSPQGGGGRNLLNLHNWLTGYAAEWRKENRRSKLSRQRMIETMARAMSRAAPSVMGTVYSPEWWEIKATAALDSIAIYYPSTPPLEPEEKHREPLADIAAYNVQLRGEIKASTLPSDDKKEMYREIIAAIGRRVERALNSDQDVAIDQKQDLYERAGLDGYMQRCLSGGYQCTVTIGPMLEGRAWMEYEEKKKEREKEEEKPGIKTAGDLLAEAQEIGKWSCPCGYDRNTANFCGMCGAARPTTLHMEVQIGDDDSAAAEDLPTLAPEEEHVESLLSDLEAACDKAGMLALAQALRDMDFLRTMGEEDRAYIALRRVRRDLCASLCKCPDCRPRSSVKPTTKEADRDIRRNDATYQLDWLRGYLEMDPGSSAAEVREEIWHKLAERGVER